MTDPRPTRELRPLGRKTPPLGEKRVSEAKSAVTGDLAPPSAPAAPSGQWPWIEGHAARIRWATWLAIALIFVRLIVPRPDGWRRWNDAAAALADVETARTSALLYYQAAARQWPPAGRAGVVPRGMLPFLPGGMSYGRARYHLRWEYAADSATGARVIGISVLGTDPRLALTIARRAPQGMPFLVSGGRFTALISSASGR